jgi:hypothetical protein
MMHLISWALMLAGFGLGVLPVFLGILNHDVAWLLHAAGRVLAGDTLYVDVVETNPPLIVWLNFAPIFFARAAGISEILAFRLLMLLVVACSLMLSGWTLRRILPDRPAGRRLILALSFFLLLPLTGYDFGEREHLLLALVWPYLLMASGRAMGRPIVGGMPWIAGGLAGVGIALKPHYVLLWVAVEGYLAWARRGWRAWLRPEAPAIAAVGMAYAIAVVAITPDYLGLVRWARSVYAFSGPVTFSSMMAETAALVSLVAWLGFAFVRPRGKYRASCEVALVANISLLSIAIVQYKGYHYHFYPPLASAMLLLGLLFIESRGLGAPRSKIAGVLCGGLAAALAIQAAVDQVVESRLWKGHPDRSEMPLGRMARLAKDHAKGGSIFTFSAAVVDSFPLVTYSGVGWASRHPCLWFLPGLYSEYYGASRTLKYHPMEAMSDTERFLFNTVVDDLLKDRPALLFVDEAEHKVAFPWQRFDYLEYFSRDPRFAAFLRQYEPLTKVDVFRIYRRKADDRPTTRSRSRRL